MKLAGKFMMVVAAFVLMTNLAVAQSQTGPATPTTPNEDLDLPFEKPTPENTPQEIQVPEEEPDPEEEPPTFHGEPIPSENSTIFYVIDASCSMGWDNRSYVDENGNRRTGNRMQRAKSELRRSVAALPRTFSFNIIAYGCSIQRFRGAMVEANAQNKAAAIGWVNGRNPNDGTMTGPATAAALQDRNNMSVVLLTDGAPNCGASGMNGHRSLIRNSNTQNAVITVFGIGASGSLRNFCQQVAADNAGSYVDVP